MLDALAKHAPEEALKKLRTFDMDAGELSATQIDMKPDLVMIDAEHTIRAAFRDFLNLSKLCGPSTVHVFHDANLIGGALQNIETLLQHNDVAFDSYVLPDAVFLLATNDARDIVKSVGQTLGMDKEGYWRESQALLMRIHHDIVHRRMQMAAPWQTSGTVKGRM